ncbi:MAG: hypothetical protein IH986_13235 [Planctomycetes bacterium]|nr:hypothetical protein [Planctomycetota bacterium]
MTQVRRSSARDLDPAHRAVVAILCLAATGQVLANDERPPDGYEIVVATAVTALPTPLRSAFVQRRDELIRVALSHGVKSVSSVVDVDRHFLVLDVAAEKGADEAGRIEASRRFPRVRDAALELARERGVRRVGSLPWTIHAHFEALVEAFRSTSGALVVAEAGALLHFATDASMPLFVVEKHSSRRRGRFFDRGADEPDPPNRREKLLEAVATLRDRLDDEVRVSPTRYAELDEPLDAVFETIAASFAELVSGPAIDAKVRADEAATMIESRLEAAALLAANLIGTAWHQAGRPSPDTWNAASAKSAEPEKPAAKYSTSVASPDARFVGSRRSSIYHRATCSHAKRIKPSNLVAFGARKVAVDAGRRPCKTCKPGAD